MSQTNLTPVQQAFQLAQTRSKVHATLVMKLLKVRRDCHVSEEEDTFLAQFLECVHRLLVVKQRAPAVERCVEFVWKFATSCKKHNEDEEDEEDFACQIIRHLLKYHNAKDSAVRFRVCQIVAATFNNLDENAEIEDDLWDSVVDCMVKRCTDKTVAVRAQATSCLRRLHEPEEKDNDATLVLIQLMNTDKAKEVRRVALSCLGISRYTLPHILTRTRDVEPTVRRKALQVLAGFDRLLEVLSISQRVRLVEQCLRDRDETVASTARDMIAMKWLPKCGEEGYDVLELLSKFDVLNEERVGLVVLQGLLQSANAPNAHSSLVSAVRNAPIMEEVQYWQVKEASLLWRAQCEYATERDDHNALEDRLRMGSIMGFCTVLKQNLPTLDAPSTEDRDYVCRQMLIQAKMLEFGHDEAGRIELNRLLTASVLDKSTPECIVSLAIEALMRTHCGNEDDYLWSMTEMISEVTDPEEMTSNQEDDEDEEQATKKRMYIQTLIQQITDKREEMTQCVRDENFSAAQSLKMDIGDLEDEIADLEGDYDVLGGKDWGLQRGLSIAEPMLRKTRQTLRQCPTLEGLWNSLLVPAMSSEFPSVRTEVAKCVGLYSLLDPSGEQGATCMPLLMRMATYDMFEVQVAAVQAMFDLIMIFPKLASFTDDQEEGERDPIDIVLSFLKDSNAMSKDDAGDGDDDDEEEDSAEIRQELTIKMTTTVAEGLARVMYNGRTRRTDVMEQLLLLFFGKSGAVSRMLSDEASTSSRSSSDPLYRARQCLHLFFPQFAVRSHQHQRIIEHSGINAFRTMMNNREDQEVDDALISGYVQFLAFYLQERESPASEAIKEMADLDSPQAASFHGRLMVTLLSELLLATSRRKRSHVSSHHLVLCKSISKLSVPTFDVVGKSLVQHLCTVCIEGSDSHGKWSAIDKKNVTRPLKTLRDKMSKEKQEEEHEWFNTDSMERVCNAHMCMLQEERDGKSKKKKRSVIATSDELDAATAALPAAGAENESESSSTSGGKAKKTKSKRKIKSKTSASASSFNLDDAFDDYSGRVSSGSNKAAPLRRRLSSSPNASARGKRVAASPEDTESDENVPKSNKQIMKKKTVVQTVVKQQEIIPSAPATTMTSMQPTKDQMLAEIDNLLSDDSDSD